MITYNTDLVQFFIILYGKSGSGKTPLAATSPNCIFLDIENKMISVKKKTPRIEINNMKDLAKARKYLSGKNGKQFDVIIIDSLTELADIVFLDLKEKEKDSRQAYMKVGEATIKELRKLKKIGKHLICICQLDYYDNDGITMYRPAMPGKALPKKTPYLFTHIFALRKIDDEEGKTKTFLLTENTETWEAKQPDERLPRYIENPDFGKIIKTILK